MNIHVYAKLYLLNNISKLRFAPLALNIKICTKNHRITQA